MDDLISRQAAIDSFPEDALAWDISDGYIAPHYVRKILETLPSAEPAIIRCKDCDWWKKQEDSLQGRCALLHLYPTEAWYCGNARRRVTE